MAGRGLQYLGDSITTDYITVPTIAAGIIAPCLSRRTAARHISFGIALYVVYVIAIGGDYMSGRFLSAPFFASLCVLGTVYPIRSNKTLATLSLAVIACNLCSRRALCWAIIPRPIAISIRRLASGAPWTLRDLRPSQITPGQPGGDTCAMTTTSGKITGDT